MSYNWEVKPLGELVSFSSGGTPSKKNPAYWGGDIPWISAKTMKAERITTSDLMITEEGLAAGSRLAPVGSLLLLTRGSGLFNGIPICIVERPVAFNQDVKCLEATAAADIRYVFYWLKSQEAYLKAKLDVTGIGAGKFDTRFLSELPVAVPDRETQAKIVSIADAISQKIIVNRKINDNLYAQAKALLQQWRVENGGKYDLIPLSDVALINPDTYSPKENWKYVNYLDTSSVTEGFITETQRIDPNCEKLPSRARRKIAENDIVFSTVRPNQRHYGIIRNPMPNMLASTGFAVLRSKHPKVSNEIIYLCLTDTDFIEKMQQLAEQSTSTFPSIKPSDLGVCKVPCAHGDEAVYLFEALNTLFTLISANQSENAKLAELRDVLLPKLMSGEIDVSDIQL